MNMETAGKDHNVKKSGSGKRVDSRRESIDNIRERAQSGIMAGVNSLRGDGQKSNEDGLLGSLLSGFSRHNYEVYDYKVDPTREQITEITEEGIPYRFTPVVLSPWDAEYFHTPYGMARLFRHMVVAIVMTFVLTFSLFVGVFSWTNAASLIVMLLLTANFAFRYYGIALYTIPMPEIPFLSDLFRETESYEFTVIAENVSASEGIDLKTGKTFDQLDREERKEEEKRLRRGGGYVREVHNVNNGVSSPGTILSTYINETLQWKPDDFADATDGVIDDTTLDLLLDDNVVAWENDNVISALSMVTNSTPEEWNEAFHDFHG